MRALREHQRRLAALIFEPDRAPNDIDALGVVAPFDGSDVRARLDAYVSGYPARIFEALDEAYPAVRHLAGDRAFAELVRRYAPHSPDGIYSLTDVGAALAEFLESDPLAERFPFLADLAALEWRVVLAFHATEKPRFDTSTLASWGFAEWGGARLELQPSVAVVCSSWPILDLWNLRETPRESIDLDLAGRAQSVLIARDGFAVRCELVDAAQALVLEVLRGGATLGEALERLASTDDEIADVSAWFAGWASRGLIAGCVSASRG